ARASQRQLEEPQEVDAWLSAFAAAVDDLAAVAGQAGDLPRVDAALLTLQALPARLGGLNEKLVEAARRLRPGQPGQTMDAPLPQRAARGPAPRGLDDLRAGVERFRDLCARLADRIDDHRDCQAADLAFAQARSLQRRGEPMPPGAREVALGARARL